MVEFVFLDKIKEIYSISQEDCEHEYESFDGVRPPYIIEINNSKVGCLAFNRGRGLKAGYIQLAYLYIYKYNNGTGTKILSEICKVADEHGVTLFLDAVPLKPELTNLPSYKLKSWYKKFGFCQLNVEGSNYMERTPKS